MMTSNLQRTHALKIARKPDHPNVVVASNDLDKILALQMTVAWAGEGECEPKRLGWWRTDLVDPEGGGYLFRELFPETHLWASLEAVRHAAVRRDREARAHMAEPDRVRTLFFWGFRLDEKIGERLAVLKQQGRPPTEALSLFFDPDTDFQRETLEEHLLEQGARGKTRVVPGGRQLVGEIPESPAEQARQLAAALLPFSDEYPAPFFLDETP